MSVLFLARHGQSTANEGRWISGWTEVELTSYGIAQAEGLAHYLERESIARLLSSDTLRARRTAEIVAHHLGVPLCFDEGLRERNYGAWTGLSYSALNVPDGGLYKRMATEEDFAPPGGETLHEHRERAVAAVRKWTGRYPGDSWLVVSHKGTMRVLLQYLHGQRRQQATVPPDPPQYITERWREKRRNR